MQSCNGLPIKGWILPSIPALMQLCQRGVCFTLQGRGQSCKPHSLTLGCIAAVSALKRWIGLDRKVGSGPKSFHKTWIKYILLNAIKQMNRATSAHILRTSNFANKCLPLKAISFKKYRQACKLTAWEQLPISPSIFPYQMLQRK